MKWLIVVSLLFVVLSSGCVLLGDKYACKIDGDCVPATCCHPNETINKAFAPNCFGVACTDYCGGPLDCGCGTPVCENNKCGIKPTSEDFSWCS